MGGKGFTRLETSNGIRVSKIVFLIFRICVNKYVLAYCFAEHTNTIPAYCFDENTLYHMHGKYIFLRIPNLKIHIYIRMSYIFIGFRVSRASAEIKKNYIYCLNFH